MNSLEIAFQSGFKKEAKEEIIPQEEKVNIPTMAAGSTAAGAGLGMLGEAITGAGRHLPPVQRYGIPGALGGVALGALGTGVGMAGNSNIDEVNRKYREGELSEQDMKALYAAGFKPNE